MSVDTETDTDTSTTDAPTREQALRAAKPPVGTGLSPLFGQLVAVLVVALGVLGVQEAVFRVGLVATSWLSWLLTRASGRAATFTTLVICVLLALVGLLLLVVVFRPRPRRALTLKATTGVYLRTADLARLARHRIDGAQGVTDVEADATRTKLTVRVSTVTPAAANEDLNGQIQTRVRPLSDAFEHAPRLTVHISNQDLT